MWGMQAGVQRVLGAQGGLVVGLSNGLPCEWRPVLDVGGLVVVHARARHQHYLVWVCGRGVQVGRLWCCRRSACGVCLQVCKVYSVCKVFGSRSKQRLAL